MRNSNKQLKQLTAVISEECDARMAKDDEVVPSQIAEWLIQQHQALVVGELTDLVCQAMARRNDQPKGTSTPAFPELSPEMLVAL